MRKPYTPHYSQSCHAFTHAFITCLLSILLLSASAPLFSQGDLRFIQNTNSSLNTISFTIAPKKLLEVHESKGSKFNITPEVVTINNNPVVVDRFRIRGSSSSHFYRKSFNIHLQKKVSFFSADSLSTKDLYAISMNMDRNYVRNKIAYAVLAAQKIVVPAHAYSNLVANGKSEGLYLIVYPPADYATKVLHAPVVIRRGYNSSVKKTYTNTNTSEEAKSITQKFMSIYKKILPKYKGEELLTQLNDVLNLEEYFTWMAFNDLFNNGDYSDEAYFMWNVETEKFDLIPWDFDDLFQLTPHETSPAAIKTKFIFSIEDKLDATISKDPVLYNEYLKTYRHFLENFTTDQLKETFERIYTEVSPYFLSDEIMEPSQYDKYGKTDIQNLEKDLNSIYMNILLRMLYTKKELESMK